MADSSPRSPCRRLSIDRTYVRIQTETAETPRPLCPVPQPLRLGQHLELLQRVVLDLADALARDPEGAADLLQGARLGARQAEAHLDRLALARGQRVKSLANILAAQVLESHVERGLRLLVLHEVAELGVLLLADRLLQRNRQLRHALDVLHLAHRALELRGDLLRHRLATELLHELALNVHDLVQLLDHVHRDADRARLVRDRARHRLADPPRRVRRELVAAPVVELLDGPDQAERPLLDEVEEREAAPEVALRDRDHEAQVRLDHVLLGRHVAALDALREADLLQGREQLDLADRTEVQPQRVERRLHREVELGPARRNRVLLLVALVLDRRRLAVGRHDVDAVLDQVRVELRDLVL